jgi:hypothetical protein
MSWMGTAVGACLGFGASILPTVLDIIRQRLESKDKLAQMNASLVQAMNAEANAANANGAHITQAATAITQAINAQTAALTAALTLVDDEPPPSRIEAILEFMKGTVRPIVTYLFFGLFFAVKMSGLIKGLLLENLSVVVLLPAIWDADSASLFAAVIGFWFGSRSMKRIKGE